MYLEIFLADFTVFRRISRKYMNFAGLRPREILEALINVNLLQMTKKNKASAQINY